MTDNLYSSEALALELLRKKIYTLGTLRKNRLPVGKPAEMMNSSKHPKPTQAYPKGKCKGSVNHDNTVALLSMMDSGLVYLIDTLHGPGVLQDMVRRDKVQEVSFLVFKAFCDYNAYMGGVDAWDALRTGYFAVEMIGRTARWTVRFVDGVFNMALAQVWVAYRFHHPFKAHYGRFDFMMELCGDFLDNDEDCRAQKQTRLAAAAAAVASASSSRYHNTVQTESIDHLGKKVKLLCEHCKTKKVVERLAFTPRTNYRCYECSLGKEVEVALHPECAGAYHNERNGFQASFKLT